MKHPAPTVPTFPTTTCEAIAALAGLRWEGDIHLNTGTVLPVGTLPHEPFFDAFGAWDAEQRTVTIDVERCYGACAPDQRDDLIEVVAAHFFARAVVQLGVHPKTGKTYVGWDDPKKRFRLERPSLRTTPSLYDDLVREQILFTQIFTYLLLRDAQADDAMSLLLHLSQGHHGLYALNYRTSRDADLVDSALRRDWLDEANADPSLTAKRAAIVLGWVTRGAPVERGEMIDLPYDE